MRSLAANRAPWRFYLEQKNNAKGRGILFLLTFDQWWSTWEQSGHWHERGKGRHKYCMARIGDVGAYELGNIKIIRHESNVSEGQRGKAKSNELRRKLSNSVASRTRNHLGQFVIVLLAVFVFCNHALAECLRIEQARTKYPKAYLYWHTSRHCWYAKAARHNGGARDRAAARPQIPTPAPSPLILYPTLVPGEAAVDPALLAGEPTSVGPPLIDIDTATASPVEPPPIEPDPPAVNFRERWQTPSTWFVAGRP
jgi:hypothetical protein